MIRNIRQISVIRVLSKFRSLFSREQKKNIVFLVILMIVGGVLEMCSVSLIMPFMEAVTNPSVITEKWYARLLMNITGIDTDRGFLILLSILLAFLYVFKNVYLLLEFNYQYRFVYGNMFEMQRTLLNNYIHRPYSFFLKVDSGEIIRIVTTDTANTFYLLLQMLCMITELVVSGMIIITIFVITPLATACMAAALIVMLLIINKFIKPVLRKAGIENQRSQAGMNKWLLQSIQGIKEVKITGKEKYFQRKYDEYGMSYVEAIRKNQVLNMTPKFFIEAVSMGSMFLVIGLLMFNGMDLDAIIPIIAAVAVAAIRLLPSINRMSTGLAAIAFYEPMLDKLIENVGKMQTTAVHKGLDAEGGTSSFPSFSQCIMMENITFSYPENEAEVLNDAVMTINKGESIGIVGNSGAGKSTAVDIILGLLVPQKGNITVDGVNIEEDIKAWNRQIGYIPQSIFMLDDTIRSNVCFGLEKDEINDEKVWYALKEASLDEFVSELSAGLDTQIGERGVRLSGGQRQRIGIARALYSNPSVLVFDEATSALDSETESSIMESIHKLHGQKTMIIIAHRLSTIEACDHIFRVADGKITKER